MATRIRKSLASAGVLLARNEIDYLKPILLHQRPKTYMYLIDIGNKSFQLGYEIYVDDSLHAKGLSILVCYDTVTQMTIFVPEAMKNALLVLKKFI